MNFKKGFTLMELMVVVGIVAILASVLLANLNASRLKGNDAAIKSNLRNAIGQGEIFFNTNTLNPNSYKQVCTNGTVGGAIGVGKQVLTAAKASGLASYAYPAIGTTATATCNSDDTNGTGWAAEVPLTSVGANQMWCVDSTGKSLQTNGSTLTATTDFSCN